MLCVGFGEGIGLAWAQAVFEKTCATTEKEVKSDVWGFFYERKNV